MIAATIVHTTGVNWLGVLANVAAVGGTICAVLAFTLTRLDKRRNAHEKWVTERIGQAVTAAGQAMGARIDTLKADIGEHMRSQDVTIDRLDRRTYRIETRMMRNRD